ncbi:fungal specific transcription factor domain-containing [Fusarium albosuccineum]|uniref:Fungal specific transcription factor domain-containing n=1 Tax=Fusarium albosuccineum TaxID=1237068 RepID=A0A8H4LAJ4_9HYPO|nr:fungal specific transcription factor domain-containing [Fusarium albosuccineum]
MPNNHAAFQPEPGTPGSQQSIIRACDMCRVKKIRCEPTEEGCARCSKYNTRCHFTPIALKRKPRRPAGYKYIAELEERLKNMEGLLEKALLRKPTRNESQLSQGEGIMDFEECQIGEADNNPSASAMELTTDYSGPVATFDDTSTLTGLPPPPWYSEIQQPSGETMQIHDPMTSPLRPSAFKVGMALGPYSLPTFKDLPPKSVALELVMETFKSINDFFPLFDEQDFLQKFNSHYLNSSPSNPEWWACINVVLCMAHRFRSMRMLETEVESAQACGYIHNALAVVAELNILHNNLSAVQALIGMALVLQGTPNPHPASVLIAAAIRLAQSMGLHRKAEDNALTEAEREQRRRVFWIAYFLDKDISLRMGTPFAQDDDDMDAELPTGSLTKLPFNNNGGPCTIDFFKSRIGLAVIQGQVYKRLYSVQATRQTEAQRSAVAQELHCILSYWRDGVDIDFEDDPTTPVRAPLSVDLLHLFCLRFMYVHCLVKIDRQLAEGEQLLAPEGCVMRGVLSGSERVSVIESRKAVRLIHMTPYGDYACVWILLHPFFASVTTLLEHVISYPTSPHAQSDIQIVKPYIRLLEVLASEKRTCYKSVESKRMHQACTELVGRAEQATQWIDQQCPNT